MPRQRLWDTTFLPPMSRTSTVFPPQHGRSPSPRTSSVQRLPLLALVDEFLYEVDETLAAGAYLAYRERPKQLRGGQAEGNGPISLASRRNYLRHLSLPRVP